MPAEGKQLCSLKGVSCSRIMCPRVFIFCPLVYFHLYFLPLVAPVGQEMFSAMSFFFRIYVDYSTGQLDI